MSWREKIKYFIYVAVAVSFFGLWTGTRLFYGIEIDPIDAQIANTKDGAEKEALIEKRNNKIVFPYSILLTKQ